jgi:hypothetical protein
LAEDGHDHFSASEFAKAAGRNIERITRKFIVGSEKRKQEKGFIEIQFRKKFFRSMKNLILDPKFLFKLSRPFPALIDTFKHCTTFTQLSRKQHHHLYFTVHIVSNFDGKKITNSVDVLDSFALFLFEEDCKIMNGKKGKNYRMRKKSSIKL